MFLVALSLSSFTLPDNSGLEKTATWSSSQDYSAISVRDDINVVLVEAPTKTITIEGPEDLVDAVRFEVRKGELKVSTTKKAAGKERVTVVIPVQNVKSLTVRGTASVTSHELLSSPRILVKITGNGMVSLKTKGKVVVDSDENHDYIYNSTKQIERSAKN